MKDTKFFVDTPIDEVEDYIKTLEFNSLSTYKKLMEFQYSKIVAMKDKLVEQQEKNFSEETKDSIQGLFAVLQKIETVATKLEKYKKRKDLN